VNLQKLHQPATQDSGRFRPVAAVSRTTGDSRKHAFTSVTLTFRERGKRSAGETGLQQQALAATARPFCLNHIRKKPAQKNPARPRQGLPGENKMGDIPPRQAAMN